MLLIIVKREIFAGFSVQGMPGKGETAAWPQAGQRHGPGEGLRLTWSLTKLKSGWILLYVQVLR